MAITFSGVGSGLPVDQIINATIEAQSYRLYKYQENVSNYKSQQSALDTIEAKYNSFDSALEKLLDSNLISAFDLFDKKSTTLSDESIANVTVGSKADTGSVEIEVNSLVQNPLLEKTNFAGSITNSVSLSDLGIIDGTISINFEDSLNNKGISLEVDVVKENTIDEFIEAINTALGENDDLSGTVTGSTDASGVLSLDFSAVETGDITLDTDNPIGSSTSNVADVFGFSAAAGVLSSEPKTSINLDGKLYGNEANINGWISDGTIPETINIGGFEYEITTETTLRQLIDAVNGSEECQAKMFYDQSSNTMRIEGKDDFYSDYVYFSGNTFLSEIGATTNGATNIASQTARQPGEIVLDGRTISIKSNKITAAETGLQGITMTLNSLTEPDEPLKITISESTEELEEALDTLIKSFNSIVSTVDQYTFSDTDTGEYGVLRTEYTVQRMHDDIRTAILSASDSELEFKALSLIGISSSDDGDGKLEFDSSEFLEAFADNPDDVKKLLIGSKDDSVKGILESIKEQMEVYLDVQTGYFATKDDSLITSIESTNKQIESEQERLEATRKRLTNQYSNLDSTMSSLNSQMSAIAGIGG